MDIKPAAAGTAAPSQTAGTQVIAGPTCAVCGARTTWDGLFLAAVPGTFAGCTSPQHRQWSVSPSSVQRRLAAGCPHIAKPVPVLGPALELAFSGRLADWIEGQLQRWAVPAWLARPLAEMFANLTANPVLFYLLVSGLLSAVGSALAVLGGAGLLIGKAIVEYVPRLVSFLKFSIDGNLLGWLGLIAALFLISDLWVRVSRRFPRSFGFLEMWVGAGAAIAGFQEPQSAYAALFALIGGTFTVIDGRQRLVGALA